MRGLIKVESKSSQPGSLPVVARPTRYLGVRASEARKISKLRTSSESSSWLHLFAISSLDPGEYVEFESKFFYLGVPWKY